MPKMWPFIYKLKSIAANCELRRGRQKAWLVTNSVKSRFFTFSDAGWRHALPSVHRVTQPSGLCRYDLWGRRHPEATCTERTSTTDDDDQPSGVQRGPQPVIIVLYLVVLPVGTCRRQINVDGRWLNACRTEGVEISRLKARFESIHGLSRVESGRNVWYYKQNRNLTTSL